MLFQVFPYNAKEIIEGDGNDDKLTLVQAHPRSFINRATRK